MPRARADAFSTNGISQLRTALGLTQTALARYLGLSRGQVAQYEARLRRMAFAPSQRLFRVQVLLPPPLGLGAPFPPPAVPDAFAPAPLPAGLEVPALDPSSGQAADQFTHLPPHLRFVAQEAALAVWRLRAEVAARLAHLRVADQQERVAAALRDPPPPTIPLLPDADPARTLRLADHLAAEAADARRLSGPLHPATLAHLRLRLWLAETEAAALAPWLPAA